MKYVCFKQVISKIVDQDIDYEDTDILLKSIMEKELTCSIRVHDGEKTNYFDSVRIKEVNSDAFSYVVSSSVSNLRKQTKLSDLAYLEITVSDKVLSTLKPNVTRWNLISPMEDKEV